jgi:hypothetical protein
MLWVVLAKCVHEALGFAYERSGLIVMSFCQMLALVTLVVIVTFSEVLALVARVTARVRFAA